MRLPARRSDDADVIRARLRLLLAESSGRRGWLPDDEPGAETDVLPVRRQPIPAAAALDEERRTEPQDEESADPVLPDGIGRHRAPGKAVRLDPGRRGAWSLWVAGLVAALLLVLWTWWDRPQVDSVVNPPQVSPAASASSDPPAPAVGEAAQTSSTVVVSVVGLVARPGPVTLPSGSRVADALARAGGLLPEPDASSVNLAAVVADGEQIAVGVPAAAAGGPSHSGPSGATSGPLDLNTATVADLDGLPGIGPVLAQRIVDHRDREGRFVSVDQLQDVPGIGPAIYGGLADLVTV